MYRFSRDPGSAPAGALARNPVLGPPCLGMGNRRVDLSQDKHYLCFWPPESAPPPCWRAGLGKGGSLTANPDTRWLSNLGALPHRPGGHHRFGLRVCSAPLLLCPRSSVEVDRLVFRYKEVSVMNYLAVGLDVTPVFQKRALFADNPETRDWHVIYTGRSFAPLPPSLFAVWEQARRRLVSDNDIVASLLDEDTDPNEAREAVNELLSDFPFAPWPWYDDSVNATMLYSELFLVGPPDMPNLAPRHIPNDLWHNKPTMRDLEKAIECAPDMDPGSVRRALAEALPVWLAIIPGLRLQLPSLPDSTDSTGDPAGEALVEGDGL